MSSQKLMDRWHQCMNTGTYTSDIERLNNARYWAKDTIKNNLVMPYRWYRDSHISNIGHIKTIRHNRKLFAKSFAIAVQNDDADYALELVNESRKVSNRFVDIMNDKFAGCYCSCDDCGHIEHENDTYSVNDGDRSVCGTCRDDNYHYSEYHDCYVDSDYDDDHPEFDNIGEYHTSSDNLGHIPSKYDNRNPRVLLGLEL
jgi:hypothetical protein